MFSNFMWKKNICFRKCKRGFRPPPPFPRPAPPFLYGTGTIDASFTNFPKVFAKIEKCSVIDFSRTPSVAPVLTRYKNFTDM